MGSSPRASPPRPVNFEAAAMSSPEQTNSTSYFDSPDAMESRRTMSCSSVASSAPSSAAMPSPTPHKSSWIKPAPTVNVHTTCGRHTDQLLFGGPSLAELARKVIGRKKD